MKKLKRILLIISSITIAGLMCGCEEEQKNYGDFIEPSDGERTVCDSDYTDEVNSDESDSETVSKLSNNNALVATPMALTFSDDYGDSEEAVTSENEYDRDVDLDLGGMDLGNNSTGNELSTKYVGGIAVKTITGISGIAFDIPEGYTYKESGDRYSIYIDDTKINVDYRKNVDSVNKDKSANNNDNLMQCGINYAAKDMLELYQISSIKNISTSEVYKVNDIDMMDFNVDITKVFVDVSKKKKEPIEIDGVVHMTVAKNKDGIYIMSYISEDATGGVHENIMRSMLGTIRKNGSASDAWREAFYVEYLKQDEKDKRKYNGRVISKDLTKDGDTLLIEYQVTDKSGKSEKKSITINKPEDYNQVYLDFTIDVGSGCKYVEVTGVTYYNGWLESDMSIEEVIKNSNNLTGLDEEDENG